MSYIDGLEYKQMISVNPDDKFYWLNGDTDDWEEISADDDLLPLFYVLYIERDSKAIKTLKYNDTGIGLYCVRTKGIKNYRYPMVFCEGEYRVVRQ